MSIIRSEKRASKFGEMLRRVSKDKKISVKINVTQNDAYSINRMFTGKGISGGKNIRYIITALNFDYVPKTPFVVSLVKSCIFSMVEVNELDYANSQYIEYDVKTGEFLMTERLQEISNQIKGIDELDNSFQQTLSEFQFNALCVLFPLLPVKNTNNPTHSLSFVDGEISLNKSRIVHVVGPKRLTAQEAIMHVQMRFSENKEFVKTCVNSLLLYIKDHDNTHIKFIMTPEQRYHLEQKMTIRNNEHNCDKYFICVGKEVICVGEKKYNRLKYPVWSIEGQCITTTPKTLIPTDGILEKTIVSSVFVCSDGSTHKTLDEASTQQKIINSSKLLKWEDVSHFFSRKDVYSNLLKFMAENNMKIVKDVDNK